MSKDSKYMWLSFADGDLPKGKQFLGGVLVEADDLIEAVVRSHALGINPGGEVLGWGPISRNEINEHYPVEQLLGKKEIERLDRLADPPKH